MSEPLTYPVPYAMLGRELTRPILNGARSHVLNVYRGFIAQMTRPPVYRGLENLPANPRFILAANHYQRKGLWIAHAAAAVGMAVYDRYACDPPVRWIVTANWPRWKVGPYSVPSAGDFVLPRVAHALWCYPVPFAGSDPQGTAVSLRLLLKESNDLNGPVGVFPEGAQATAGELRPALPGVGRLIVLMARRGWAVLPAGVSEHDGRFVIHFGTVMDPSVVCHERDPGAAVMDRIGRLLSAGD